MQKGIHMSMMVGELYDALRAAGVSEELARKASRAVLGSDERDRLVTQAILRAELAELKADLVKWGAGLLVASRRSSRGSSS